MKRWLVLAFAAIAIAGYSTVSFAAVAGSHHDMTTWTGNAQKDTCYPCHGIKPGAGEAFDLDLGSVGSLCYARCHSSNSGAAGGVPIKDALPEVGAWDNGTRTLKGVDYTITSPGEKYGEQLKGGHKMYVSLPGPDPISSVTGSGLPYADCTLRFQCTTCHDVHSNAVTPFLRINLFPTGATSTTGVGNGFCEKCHSAGDAAGKRWVSIGNAPNGSHPSEVADWAANAHSRSDTGTTAIGTPYARHGRTIVMKDVDSASKVPAAVNDNGIFRNLTYVGSALNPRGQHYNPGGKLGWDCTVNTTNTLTGPVGCYTCHATHLPSAAGMSQLTVAKYKGESGYSDMCVGCHGGSTTTDNTEVPANPGTTAYFHPVESDSHPNPGGAIAASKWTTTASSAFTITVNLDNGAVAGAVPLGNVTNLLLCASCHTTSVAVGSGGGGPLAGVHNAQAGTMLLNPKKPSCESCHNTTVKIDGLTANSHHVYGGTTNYTATSQGGYPATITYSGTYTANLADGLQCNDCHTFNKTAHNW